MDFIRHELGLPSPRHRVRHESQSMTLGFEQDVCERKHGGNANSVEANKRVNKTAQREILWREIKKHGVDGRTSKELSDDLRWPLNTFSGRFKEMRKHGWIRTLGSDYNRDGAAVHVALPRTNLLASVGVN